MSLAEGAVLAGRLREQDGEALHLVREQRRATTVLGPASGRRHDGRGHSAAAVASRRRIIGLRAHALRRNC